MKRVKIFLLLSIMAFLYSCTKEYPLLSQECFSCNDIFSRSMTSDESLEEGSVALFNASGGLQMDHQFFTLKEGKWVSEQNVFWQHDQCETYIAAIYPAYEGKSYTTETLYSADGLDDILIAKDTLSAKKEIDLEFYHLFSKFTVNVNPTLHETLKELHLTTPVKVHSLSAKTGVFVLSENSEENTTIRSKNGTGVYSFVIPPSDNCSLKLRFVMVDDHEYEFVLTPHNFRSGYGYECNVVGEKPGIQNVEDLKAFCLLINGDVYTGEKKLSDFGSEEEGKMVYRLLSDLVLTEKDCSELFPIGYKSEIPFVATFDGQNHTISNLMIQSKKSVAGFFGRIEENGLVKDLHLDLCTTSGDVSTASLGVGFLAGYCSGTIDGCSVRNGELSVSTIIPTGGLVGSLRSGNIVNSFVSSTNVVSYGYLGSLVGSNNGGCIINTYSASNRLTRKNALCGGLVGSSKNGSLINCYLYKLQLTSTAKFGLLIGSSNASTVKSVFFDFDFGLIKESTNDVLLENYPYSPSSFTTVHGGVPIALLLQNWVENEETENVYSAYTFKSWISDETLPAIFE